VLNELPMGRFAIRFAKGGTERRAKGNQFRVKGTHTEMHRKKLSTLGGQRDVDVGRLDGDAVLGRRGRALLRKTAKGEKAKRRTLLTHR